MNIKKEIMFYNPKKKLKELKDRQNSKNTI